LEISEILSSDALHTFSTIVGERPPRPWLYNEWIFKHLSAYGAKSYDALDVMHKFTGKVRTGHLPLGWPSV